MKKSLLLITAAITLLIGMCAFGGVQARAEEAGAVSVGETDYEELTMRIYTNGNSIVYISTDNRKSWAEIEGSSDSDGTGTYIEMDISWASPSSAVKLYFKGNSNKNEVSCTLPKQDSSFKVKFDKVSGDFVMTTDSETEYFYWRKASDYNWTKVPFEAYSKNGEYKAFLETVESLRFKGAKLVFRLGQIKGSSDTAMGERPGKEVSVSITKFSSAPSVKLNINKLTLNTKDTMEYTLDISSGKWTSCEKTMELGQLAPQVYLENGSASSATIYFRVAQTEKRAASLIGSITIPAQTAGPEAGASGKDVTVTENADTGKLDLQFKTASADNMLEYCVIKPDKEFELSKAKWKVIKNNKTVSLTKKAAPDGTVIYFRYKGIAQNVNKGIEMKLPSQYVTFTVKWTEKQEDSSSDKNKN